MDENELSKEKVAAIIFVGLLGVGFAFLQGWATRSGASPANGLQDVKVWAERIRRNYRDGRDSFLRNVEAYTTAGRRVVEAAEAITREADSKEGGDCGCG